MMNPSLLNIVNKKFLVIGSNSFSGSHFVDDLINLGIKVLGVSRSEEPIKEFLPYKWDNKNLDNFHFEKIDLNKNLDKLISLITKFRPTHIVNFASQGMVAESWKKPIDWYKTNVISQVALHDEIRKLSFLEKYVHVTTPEVYGDTGKGWIKENFNFSPSTPYAVSRACCDLHLMSFFKSYKFPVVFTRAANVYGPGQQLYRIIPRAILSAKCNKKMNLHGGGISERSFIFIKDVTQATLQLALDAAPGTSWHLSTNEKISIKSLVEKIFTFAGKKSDHLVLNTDDRLGKDQSYLLDSSKIRKEFGWKDDVKLDIGLRLTMDWINQNLEIFENISWNYSHKS